MIDSVPDDGHDATAEEGTERSSHLHRDIGLLGLSEKGDLDLTLSSFDPDGSTSKLFQKPLCHVYLQNVDPIIKVLHRPSIAKLMIQGEHYLGYPDDHISVQAIRAAVSYAAASSLSETQCWLMFHTEKSSLVSGCRKACEFAVERANLLTTRDITVLQAFVLYLVGFYFINIAPSG